MFLLDLGKGGSLSENGESGKQSVTDKDRQSTEQGPPTTNDTLLLHLILKGKTGKMAEIFQLTGGGTAGLHRQT